MRIDTNKQITYMNTKLKRSFLKIEENKKEADSKVTNETEKKVPEKTKKKKIRYLLEGDVIKVYVYEGDKKKCIKVIPVADARPDELSQVENLSFKDVLRIMQKQRSAKVI